MRKIMSVTRLRRMPKLVLKKPKAMTQVSVIGNQLAKLLANTYCLYLKTQNFHWNITGPNFYMLHLFLEKQYEELGEAADVIAERMRALKLRAPGSFSEFTKLMSLSDAKRGTPSKDMIKILAADHEAIVAMIRKVLSTDIIKEDEGTQDLFIQRLREHEKTIWMLTAHFSPSSGQES